MLTKALSASLVALVVVACGGASSETNGLTTTTTSGAVPANGGACRWNRASCVVDSDCCSLWCANSVCATRQP